MAESDKNKTAAVTIRCATWRELEEFCDQKLGLGETILADIAEYVPEGETITVALELPNDMIVAFDTRIVGSTKTATGAAVSLTLIGSNRPIVRQLRALIDEALTVREGRVATLQDLPPMRAPTNEQLSEDVERAVYMLLQKQLSELRGAKAENILDKDNLNRSYCEVIARAHPGKHAYLGSSAIKQTCDDIILLVNGAYRALAAPQQGLALHATARERYESEVAALFDGHTEASDDATLTLEVDDLIAQNKFDQAGQAAAAGIKKHPESRALRARYHYASGKAALENSKPMVATSQFEAAVAFDGSYTPAQEALDRMRTIRRRN